ncbi:MAG: glycosyltransferase family 2 protein [Fischerella sp. CENA71]|nr:glycosyltransferase family 2 protein [Fischerella sp. CENA71]
MAIQISAIICTLNRASYLLKSLQSLVDQTLDNDKYEIIVVDNHSTDDTKRVVTEEFSHVSNLRYLYEPVIGLSQTRNTGCQNAKGEYIAYLDDDAIACPNWLEKILEDFKNVHPKPGIIGGKIEPIWEAPKPNWLSDNLLPYLTILNLSETPTFLEDWRYVAGANMSLPKSLLEKVGGFQANLGRQGKRLLSNEELLLQEQLKDLGYKVYYDPNIFVKHHIPESRLTKNWFTKRFYWQGISKGYLLLHKTSPSKLERIKLCYREIKNILRQPKKIIHLIIPNNHAFSFSEKCLKLEQIGFILALSKLSKYN